jgi:hypothetical protein
MAKCPELPSTRMGSFVARRVLVLVPDQRQLIVCEFLIPIQYLTHDGKRYLHIVLVL